MNASDPSPPQKKPTKKALKYSVRVHLWGFVIGSAFWIFSVVAGNFVVSDLWLEQVKWPARILGACLAASSTLAVVAGVIVKLSNPSPKSDHRMPATDHGKAVLIVAAPLFFFVIWVNIIVVVPPTVVAAMPGASGQVTLTVARPTKGYASKCGRFVYLEGRTFMHNRLCRVSEEMQSQLKRGTEITVYGRGSNMGVFWQRAEWD